MKDQDLTSLSAPSYTFSRGVYFKGFPYEMELSLDMSGCRGQHLHDLLHTCLDVKAQALPLRANT